MIFFFQFLKLDLHTRDRESKINKGNRESKRDREHEKDREIEKGREREI